MGLVDTETRDFYQTVLRNNGIAESIKNMQIRVPEELHGEHFASICEYVTIQLEGGKEMHFFVKRTTTNPENLAMITFLNAFGKEEGAFNTLIKDMQLFYAKRTKSSNKTLDLFPKCYFADETRVVLENLVKNDYFLMSKVDKLDLELTKFALRSYAQLHSVSYAMSTEMGGETLDAKYPCLSEGMLKPGESDSFMSRMFFIPLLKNATEILNSVGDIQGKEFVLNILAKYDHKQIFDEMMAAVRNDDGSQFLPLANHGDSWLNNMMWHRDPGTQEIDHLILCDFQAMRYGSPNLELGYFLYASTKGEVRRKNIEDLRKFYFSKFKEYALDLGVPFEHDFQDFVKDYKRRSIFGFWIAVFMLISHEALTGYDAETEAGAFADNVNSKVSKFTSENPDKAVAIATEICAMFKEQFDSN